MILSMTQWRQLIKSQHHLRIVWHRKELTAPSVVTVTKERSFHCSKEDVVELPDEIQTEKKTDKTCGI